LKKLSHQLQPYRKVVQLIKEVSDEEFKKIELKGRVLEHLILYAENQFGDRVPLRVYRERENGETIDNWTVEIKILIFIYSSLADLLLSDESLDMVSSDNLRFPLYEKMLGLLRPWSVDLDSNSTGRIDSISKDRFNEISFISATVENNVALIYIHRSQYNLVENHCQGGLDYARLYEGTEDEKADLLCEALGTFFQLRLCEGNYADALVFIEEAYNCVAVVYNPVHPKVQSAASRLIECLTLKRRFTERGVVCSDDARFAERLKERN
jgi:hypothetical protein